MENNNNRRLVIATGLVLLFVIVVLVWYFFYLKPVVAPTMTNTNNPLTTRTTPPRFQFLNWGGENSSTLATETTDPLKDPLVEVWDKPAAGQVFTTGQILKEITATSTEGTSTKVIEIKKTVRATSTILLFVDRTTGYVYGYPLDTGIPYQISNTVVPGVHDAYFFNNGKNVVMRYIDREKNKVVALTATVPSVLPTGEALPLSSIAYLSGEVSSVAVNSRKDTVSYIVSGDNGSTVYSLTQKGSTLVTSSPFREWVLSYGGNSLFVTTKPSAYIDGTTMSLPYFQSEMDGKTGLMSIPSQNGMLLNSMWSSKGLATFTSYNGDTKVLPFATLASKCVWGNKEFLLCAVPRILPRATEGLPDDWFQGRVSFSDDLYFVDIATSEKYPVYTFSEKDGVFDITNLITIDNNDIFSFNKKQDGTLWLLNTNLIQGN